MANPYYIEPANPLQALMLGQQAYGEAQQSQGRRTAADAIRSGGNMQNVLAELIASGDPQMAKTIADMELAKTNAEWNKTYQGGMLDIARQREGREGRESGRPKIVGNPESGYYAVNPDTGLPWQTPQPTGPQGGHMPVQGSGGSMLGGGEVIVGGGPAPAVAQAPPGQIIPPKTKSAKELSPSDRKVIQTDENELSGLEFTVKNIQRAKELNPMVYTGIGAGLRGKAGTSGIPGAEYIFDPQRAQATTEWDQLMGSEAIKMMSETLKGASTDFEMRKFLNIAADTSQPENVRNNAMDRFLWLANREMEIKRTRMDQIRGGTYYQPGGGQSTPPGGKTQEQVPAGSNRAAPPEGAVDLLRKNPKAFADQFDAKYGPGAAARALGMQ